MTSFWQDVRYSARMIAKAPGYAAIAILTLALGIGANTTIFCWINSALLNPVPGLTNPNEVVALTREPSQGKIPSGLPILISKLCATGNRALTGIAACNFAQLSLTGKAKPERVWGMVASANYFDVLGVRPILGRTFLAGRRRKAGRRARRGNQLSALANTFRRKSRRHRPVNRNQQTPLHHCGCNARSVSGKPDGSAYGDLAPDHDGSADCYRWATCFMTITNFVWLAFGRLKPGVTLEQAQAGNDAATQIRK